MYFMQFYGEDMNKKDKRIDSMNDQKIKNFLGETEEKYRGVIQKTCEIFLNDQEKRFYFVLGKGSINLRLFGFSESESPKPLCIKLNGEIGTSYEWIIGTALIKKILKLNESKSGKWAKLLRHALDAGDSYVEKLNTILTEQIDHDTMQHAKGNPFLVDGRVDDLKKFVDEFTEKIKGLRDPNVGKNP
jgi:hypothetical protein